MNQSEHRSTDEDGLAQWTTCVVVVSYLKLDPKLSCNLSAGPCDRGTSRSESESRRESESESEANPGAVLQSGKA